MAIPGRVISLVKNKAQVSFGEAVLREVDMTLVDARVGDYVLVHAGYAIEVLDEKEAEETFDLWNQILAANVAQE